MLNRTVKTLAKGLSKTRSGSSPVGIQTLINRATHQGFSDRIKKAVSDEEALEAAKLLTTRRGPGRVRRYAEGAVAGGFASPVIRAIGRATEAAVGAPMGTGLRRVGLARAAAKATSRGEIARHVAEGTLAGGGVRALRDEFEVGRAKKTVKKFLDLHSGAGQLKQSGVEPAPQSRGIPKKKPSDPWRYDPRPAGEI